MATRQYRGIPIAERPCTACGQPRGKTYTRASRCRPCHKKQSVEGVIRRHGSHRNFWLKKRYGITEQQFDQMAAAQGGVCLICESVPPTDVDHCHATGRVRGLLCSQCNTTLGHVENREWMQKAQAYLAVR